MSGGDGNLYQESQQNIDLGLAHLESAYEYFVNERGFRSTALPQNTDQGPYYKMNLYVSTTLNAAGAMGADPRMGLSFIELKGGNGEISIPGIAVREFGHSLTYTAEGWVDQGRTGAWWETIANWVADEYQSSPAYQRVRNEFGLPDSSGVLNTDVVLGRSYLTIVHQENLYDAWPFIEYLDNNPDNYAGLGAMVVPNLFSNHLKNNETPLHVLERLAAPVSVQTILGRYWARMAYLDINNTRALQRFLNVRNNSNFRSQAYANLASVGNNTYQVKTEKKPYYGGANITPLQVTDGGAINVSVSNLGNGLSDSNFTATLAIRNSNGSVRYIDLINGSGQVTIASGEEVSLVVANTPDSLYRYNAFESTSASPELQGLNYQLSITGAVPQEL